MKGIPKWRVAVGTAVLALLAVFGVQLTPHYLHNLELQRFVDDTTQRVENHTSPDSFLRTRILDKAAELGLPVKEGDVQIRRSPGNLRIDVKYIVRVDLPLYTVDLHFYPGAGSR